MYTSYFYRDKVSIGLESKVELLWTYGVVSVYLSLYKVEIGEYSGISVFHIQ